MSKRRTYSAQFKPQRVNALGDNMWNVQDYLINEIQKAGGFVNAHGHFDRAFTLTQERLPDTHASLERKWELNDDLKLRSSVEDYVTRIERAVEVMIAQGVRLCATFIDVDPLSELRAIQAATLVRERHADQITFLIANQTLRGVLSTDARYWFERALDYVDIIGGLPSRDRPNLADHIHVLLQAAQDTGKPVHVHIDQENNPNERDTEVLARKTIEYGLEGQVVAIHAISVAAQHPNSRRNILALMRDAGLSVVCCPSAALSMRSLPMTAVIHNSIAPVPEMLEAGIPVALGVDNIADIYCPLVDGNLYIELRLLADACRFYDMQKLIQIATVFGRQVLKQR